MKKRIKILLAAALAAAMLTLLPLFLLYFGLLHLNHPSRDDYPVRGVDVSGYQGKIDWDVLADQGIDFAFIKATEGSSFVDRRFEANWEGVGRTDLFFGAYHFFSFESAGALQAEHFIDTVGPAIENSLPPVIDLEYYNAPDGTDLSPDTVRRELGYMIDRLTEYYGRPPILYVTEQTYADFVKGYFPDCPIWIRSVWRKPALPDGVWTFWQYSNRHRLDGYDGEERYIDMNLYNGDRESFWERFAKG